MVLGFLAFNQYLDRVSEVFAGFSGIERVFFWA